MATKTRTRTRTPKQIAAAEAAAAAKAALMARLDAYQDNPGAQDMIRIMHFAQHYSERNAMLIVMQSPEATEVHGYTEWQELGRQVPTGQHGIRILAPAGQSDGTEAQPATDTTPATEGKPGRKFFKLISVFDISQTITADEAAARRAARIGTEHTEAGIGWLGEDIDI